MDLLSDVRTPGASVRVIADSEKRILKPGPKEEMSGTERATRAVCGR